MTPQSFPTQAAKDAALLELADWLVENTGLLYIPSRVQEWRDKYDELYSLKSLPIEPG